jgi:integrase
MPSERSTLRRHVPVKGHRGIYWSGTERNKRFEIRYTDGTGKRRFEVVGSRLDEAKARLAEVTVARQRGERVTRATMTFAGAVEEWRTVRNIKRATAEAYDRAIRLHLMPRFGRTRVSDIDTIALRSWLLRLERESGLASSTQAHILATMSVILGHAVEAGALSANPVKSLSRRVKPRPTKLPARILSPEEERKLLASCGRRRWMISLIQVTLLAGLRLGEVCGLQWDDVDLAAGKLHIRHNLSKDGRTLGTPKGGPATIDLHPEVRRILVELRMAARPGCEYVFTGRGGQRKQPRDIQRAWGQIIKRAGLTEEPRRLRLANAPGVALPRVKEYLRHANIQTTMGYIHRVEDAGQQAAMWEALAG